MSKEEVDNITDYIDSQENIKPRTNGRRNKVAGSNYERQVVNKLKSIGFTNVGTSRNNSRAKDALKIDIVNCNEDKYGRLPYNFQCKTLAKPCAYGKLLAEMPKGKEVNVILHKQTKKDSAGRFQKVGEYAIMNAEDFYNMIAELENYKSSC